MQIISYYLGYVLITAGLFFVSTAIFGFKRMPDVFCKLHATSIADSLGYPMCYFGLAFISGWSLLSLKYLLLIVLSFLLSPLVTFSLAKSAYKNKNL